MGTVYEEHGRIERFFSSQDPLKRAVRRPWTVIADLVTGVVERKENATYDTKLLREWVEGVGQVNFKDGTSLVQSDRKYVIKGTEDYIVGSIDSFVRKNEGTSYGMQSMRLRDGTIKITVNRTSSSFS